MRADTLPPLAITEKRRHSGLAYLILAQHTAGLRGVKLI
jgi:hypothetical protein